MFRVCQYTVSQKVYPLMFDNNFRKMWTDFQNFCHQLIRKKKISMYIPQSFPTHLQHVVTLPCEI